MVAVKRKTQAIENLITENPAVIAALHRNDSMEHVIKDVLNWWDFDIYKRRPGPAIDDEGEFIGTDLDLATFLFSLVKRNAVIVIPSYKSLRQSTKKAEEHVVSKENRHGKLIGLTANKHVFTFSVKIFDTNVITSNDVGAFRNFLITDMDGTFYDGWKTIQFIPSQEEQDYIRRHGLAVQDKISFNTFVHPERWRSIFGQYYFATRVVIDRLEDEAKWLYNEIKTMNAAGIQLPSELVKPSEYEKPSPSKSIKVTATEFEVDHPELQGSYYKEPHNVATLIKFHERRKSYLYQIIPALRFATRTCELAYIKYGNNRVPHWFKGRNWEEFTFAGKRIVWNRFVMHQYKVGSFGLALRYRQYLKSEKVKDDSTV